MRMARPSGMRSEAVVGLVLRRSATSDEGSGSLWQKVNNGSNLLDLLIHPRGLFKDPYMEPGWGKPL